VITQPTRLQRHAAVPWADAAADLADAYLDLLENLGMTTVMVIGNSLGGWIASEMRCATSTAASSRSCC